MKLKILFILPTLHAGGAENYALRFIGYCGNKEYEWHVLSPNLKKGDLHDDFESAGCKIYYQSIGYFSPSKAWRLYSFFKKERFQVVANFNGNFSGLSLWIANMAGIAKRIAWHRRSTDAFGNNPFKKLYNRFANQLVRWNATHILSNSQFALDNFYGNYQRNDKRFKVIPNGVDAAMFDVLQSKEEARQLLGLPQGVFMIGHVGRYDPAKNHETMFKVIVALKEKGQNFKFLFCGKGTDGDVFQNRLRHYGIEDVALNIGLSKNIPLVYKCLDLFYFPSITEGQPNALIEAMISGLPFLTSDIPSIREAVPESVYDELINPFDTQRVFANIEFRINKGLTDESGLLSNWAEEKFDSKSNFEKFRRIFIEL